MENLTPSLEILHRNLPFFRHHMQSSSSINGSYSVCENIGWTSGFYPGEIALAYAYTNQEEYRKDGEEMVQSFLSRIINHIDVDHHDMGFLYSPSCVYVYRLTGNKDAKKAALLAADQLLTRFHEKGSFLQAWGLMHDKSTSRFIIDCLMNLPLLYFATEETGDPKYREIAILHTKTCLQYSFRPDGSCYHTYYMDEDTGEGLRGETCQGYSADSSWARGQAWAVYGLALAYRYTQDATLPQRFEKTLHYFLSHLPKDHIPYWDMIFTTGTEPRDTSSASIVAAGLLEMASLVPEKRKEYTDLAKTLISAVQDFALVHPGDKENGLVRHGTYSKHSPYNTCTEEGVDECVSWGDYFYLEAMMRLENPQMRTCW